VAKGDVCEVCGVASGVHQSIKYQRTLCGKHIAQLNQYGKIFKRTQFDKNKIVVNGDTAEITVYNRSDDSTKTSKFNSVHVDLVKDHKWRLGNHGYLMTTVDNKALLFHRLITGAKKGEVVDHRDHCTLNNTDDNLRVCNRQDNGRNAGIRKNNTSGVTGVTWNSNAGKWMAQMTIDYKNISLGLFDDINDAISVRKAAEIKYFGEFRYKEVI